MAITLSRVEKLWVESISPKVSFPANAEISPIQEGYSTEVYQVSHQERQKVLRIYPARSKSRFAGYLEANRVFSDFGMRVPKVESVGADREISWVFEERIEGTSYRRLGGEVEALAKAAKTLVILHSHTRNRYGEVRGWGGFRLTLRWRQRFPERWRKVIRLFPELAETTEAVQEWYRDWSDSYSPKVYQLLHNDYHPGNLILTSEGEVALLDLRSPRYGLGLMELVEACHSFTGEEVSDWSPFLVPYTERGGVDFKDTFSKYHEGCHAVFHLRQADRFADLALGERGTILDRRRWEENALDSWERFRRISGLLGPVLHLPISSAFRTVKKGIVG